MQTIAGVVDQLIVANIRIWHLIDRQRSEDLSQEIRLDAALKVDKVNQQRNGLIDELDKMIDNAIQKGTAPKFEKNKL
jgi:hypothetical protein